MSKKLILKTLSGAPTAPPSPAPSRAPPASPRAPPSPPRCHQGDGAGSHAEYQGARTIARQRQCQREPGPDTGISFVCYVWCQLIQRLLFLMFVMSIVCNV